MENTTASMVNSVQEDWDHILGEETLMSEEDMLYWFMTALSNGTFSGETIAIDELPLKKIVYNIKFYYIPVVIGFGIIGNCLTCYIMLRTKLRKLSSNHYICASAAANIVFLISLFLSHLQEFSIDLYNRPGWCHFLSFSSSVSTFLSLWFMVCFSLDRFCSIFYPIDFSIFKCPSTSARVVILALVIISIVVFMNISLTVGVIHIGKISTCVPLPMFLKQLRILNIFDVILNVTIPYLGMLCACISFICQNVRECYEYLKKKHNLSSLEPRLSVRNMSSDGLLLLTPMYIGMFLLLRIPSEMFRVMHAIHDLAQKPYMVNKAEYYVQHLLQQLYYTSFAIHLPVCMLFYRGFRYHLKELAFETCIKRNNSVMDENSNENEALMRSCHSSPQLNNNSEIVVIDIPQTSRPRRENAETFV